VHSRTSSRWLTAAPFHTVYAGWRAELSLAPFAVLLATADFHTPRGTRPPSATARPRCVVEDLLHVWSRVCVLRTQRWGAGIAARPCGVAGAARAARSGVGPTVCCQPSASRARRSMSFRACPPGAAAPYHGMPLRLPSPAIATCLAHREPGVGRCHPQSHSVIRSCRRPPPAWTRRDHRWPAARHRRDLGLRLRTEFRCGSVRAACSRGSAVVAGKRVPVGCVSLSVRVGSESAAGPGGPGAGLGWDVWCGRRDGGGGVAACRRNTVPAAARKGHRGGARGARDRPTQPRRGAANARRSWSAASRDTTAMSPSRISWRL